MQHIVRSLKSLLLAGLVSIVACGGDSAAPTAPTTLSAHDALQSLTKGLTPLDQSSAPSAGLAALGILPPVAGLQTVPVGQVTVSVDGASIQMFAMAQRVIYPPGTCLEQLLGISSFAGAGSCTSPPGALSLILWQTNSVSQPPDRIVVVIANIGTSNFADQALSDSTFLRDGDFPALALYVERNGAMWMTSGGSIMSTVTATGQSCATVLPVFAKSATCALGSFAESGNLTFSPLDLGGPGSPTATGTHSLGIPAQVIAGMIQTITVTAPFTFPTS